MSKNRREWFDAVMSLAIWMVGVAVLMFSGCRGRNMNPWPLTLGSLGVAVVLFLIAAVIHEGRDVLALPQALWMAIQDWFRRRRNC